MLIVSFQNHTGVFPRGFELFCLPLGAGIADVGGSHCTASALITPDVTGVGDAVLAHCGGSLGSLVQGGTN